MPVHEAGPDPNGLFYQVVTTQEWQSSYGESLRAQGYRYCGLGSYGIIVAPPGGPCWYRKGVTPPPGPDPNIGPTVLPVLANGSPTPSSGGNSGGCCGCGGKPSPATVTQAPVSGPGPGAPTPAGAMPIVARLRGLPWWVYVLAILAVSQALNKGRASG